MQQNTIIGNIARMTGIPGTQKVFLTVADHYTQKDKAGKTVQKVNYVPLEGFLPEGLTLSVGQLVAVRFRVQSFQTKTGEYRTANDIVSIDVTLRSKGKAGKTEDAPEGEVPAAASEEAAPAMADVPEAPDMD